MTDQEAYLQYVNRRAARSPVLRNCAAAFWVGGSLCLAGQLLLTLYRALGAPLQTAGTLVSLTLVLASALATGFGVFDRVARYAGAGTLLPITGFANSIVSSAIDTKSEGLVLGVGAKIFTVAGPVLLYGTAAATLYGLIYYLLRLIF